MATAWHFWRRVQSIMTPSGTALCLCFSTLYWLRTLSRRLAELQNPFNHVQTSRVDKHLQRNIDPPEKGWRLIGTDIGGNQFNKVLRELHGHSIQDVQTICREFAQPTWKWFKLPSLCEPKIKYVNEKRWQTKHDSPGSSKSENAIAIRIMESRKKLKWLAGRQKFHI